MEGTAQQHVMGVDLNGEAAAEPEAHGRCLSEIVDEGRTESLRYYLSRRTVLEMLRDRGYDVPDSQIQLSLPEFRSLYGETPDIDRLRISFSLLSDPSDQILVIFCGPGIVKVNVIRGLVTQIVNKDSLSRLILIVENQVTKQAMKAVDLFSFEVEMLQITDLLVNITKHVLKPKHRVLTDEEKQNLLKKFTLEEKQLPRMLQKDAIARYYGLEKGQVVKFTYGGEMTESYTSYRCIW